MYNLHKFCNEIFLSSILIKSLGANMAQNRKKFQVQDKMLIDAIGGYPPKSSQHKKSGKVETVCFVLLKILELGFVAGVCVAILLPKDLNINEEHKNKHFVNFQQRSVPMGVDQFYCSREKKFSDTACQTNETFAFLRLNEKAEIEDAGFCETVECLRSDKVKKSRCICTKTEYWLLIVLAACGVNALVIFVDFAVVVVRGCSSQRCRSSCVNISMGVCWLSMFLVWATIATLFFYFVLIQWPFKYVWGGSAFRYYNIPWLYSVAFGLMVALALLAFFESVRNFFRRDDREPVQIVTIIKQSPTSGGPPTSGQTSPTSSEKLLASSWNRMENASVGVAKKSSDRRSIKSAEKPIASSPTTSVSKSESEKEVKESSVFKRSALFFDIVTKPNFELVFSNPINVPNTVDLVLHNPNHAIFLAYNIKVTHRNGFNVQPHEGVIGPAEKIVVHISRKPNIKYHANDVVKLISTEVSPGTQLINPTTFEAEKFIKRKELLIKHLNPASI